MTNEAKNKHTLLEFYRLFYNEKRFEEGALLLSENFVNHHPGADGKGRQGMVEDFGHHARTCLADFHIDARRLVAEGDFVWTYNFITGLPQGARAVSVEIWRFDNGAIAEHWDVAQRLKADEDPTPMC